MGDVVEISCSSPQAHDPAGSFIKKLDEAYCLLMEFGRLMEEQFVSVGQNIQEFSNKATAITDSAHSASLTISSDELQNAVTGLTGMVDKLETIFKRVEGYSGSNRNTLSTVGQTVKVVEKELDGLTDTSRDLKMLALSTKIQSTKTGDRSSEFMQLGHDIDAMAVIISSKADDLLKETASLYGIVLDVHDSLEKLGSRQKYQAQCVLSGTKSIIVSMTDLGAVSKNEAGRIVQSADEIKQSVSQMVTAVQYQDIARQRIERTLEGFRDTNLATGCSQPEADSEVPGLQVEIRLAGHCLKQMTHVEQTEEMVKEALHEIVKSLEVIVESIHRMADITRTFSRNSTSFLSNLESAMSKVTSFLQEVVQSSTQMSDSMSSLGRIVDNMSAFTRDIEMIGSEVELISLNARIMAAQAGKNGAGMGVLADAVRKTSLQSDAQRILVVKGLSEITAISEDLKVDMKDANRSDKESLGQLIRELGVFLDALRIMQKKNLSMLDHIDEHSSELLRKIERSVVNLRSFSDRPSEVWSVSDLLRKYALDLCSRIGNRDLAHITGGRYSKDELARMDNHQRLDLIGLFYDEHYSDTDSPLPQGVTGDDEDITFFDSSF